MSGKLVLQVGTHAWPATPPPSSARRSPGAVELAPGAFARWQELLAECLEELAAA